MADMEFVQKFTPPDFQVKILHRKFYLISTVLVRKNEWKWRNSTSVTATSKLGEIRRCKFLDKFHIWLQVYKQFSFLVPVFMKVTFQVLPTLRKTTKAECQDSDIFHSYIWQLFPAFTNQNVRFLDDFPQYLFMI